MAMSKKSKNKKKKVSAKSILYEKFHKEKPAATNLTMPDLDEEQNKLRMADQDRIDMFLRANRNRPTKEVSERRMKSKR